MNILINNSKSLLQPLTLRSPFERCGVVLGERHEFLEAVIVLRFIELPNASDDPTDSFVLRRKAIDFVMGKTNLDLLGYWHTHNKGQLEGPSKKDMDMMSRHPSLLGMVYYQPTGIITWFRGKNIIKKEVLT